MPEVGLMTSFRNFGFLVLLLFCVGLIHAQTPTDITAQLTFTTVDVPGAGATAVFGINTAGDMVGIYGTTNNGPYHGFLFSSGGFTFFDYPGAPSTTASGINDSGLIVGYAGSTRVRGFLYDGTTFTSIRHGSDSATFSMGINNAGDVVGGAGSIYTTKGFGLRGGRFKAINFPGEYVYNYATGINKFGTIVGWADNVGYSYRAGQFKTIDFPGAYTTEAWRINDSDTIVGWYNVGTFTYGFALLNGQYTSFSYPGAKGTFAYGINASGQIVGEYTFDYQAYHGFLTSPIMAHFEWPRIGTLPANSFILTSTLVRRTTSEV
jgi:probable HAF family extracellular repeat protein